MECERKHKATKYETKRPAGTCGGEMIDVKSADGARTFGRQCNRCGAVLQKCEACGDLFVSLQRHLVDAKGKTKKCYSANKTFRTMLAAQRMGVGLP